MACVQAGHRYPNREMSIKADRSAPWLAADASWDELIFVTAYAAAEQRQSAEKHNTTRKTTEQFKRKAWVRVERFVWSHVVSLPPNSHRWIVMCYSNSETVEVGQTAKEPHTAHTFSTQTGKKASLLIRYIWSFILWKCMHKKWPKPLIFFFFSRFAWSHLISIQIRTEQ